jgi:predicted GNAT family N-acyltransferase
MNIKIRKIRAEDTYKLRHEVMWPDKALEFVKLPNDRSGHHFGLFKNEEIISIVSLFIDHNKAQFRKFATKTSEQGNGYGTLLIQHLLTFANDQKVDEIWCNARADKCSFYEKFGLKSNQKEFIREEIHYVIMDKNLRYQRIMD